MFEPLQQFIDTALWSARADETTPRRLVRQLARYPYAIVRDALEGQLTMRAMSLVYTTLLSVVPLIALSFSILKAFDVHNMVEPVIMNFLLPLGQTQAQELTAKVTEFVDNVRGVALGSVGLTVLLYTVISMVQKVEESLNYVWQVERSRSFARRFSEYLSVLLVAPVLMLTATALVGAISSHSLVERLRDVNMIGYTLSLAGKAIPLLMVSIVFSFIYALLPNTRVRPRAALAGGLAAGVMWVTVGALFASFVAGSTKYTAIYATFAAVIIALFWLYANWLILLVGAKVSFYIQHPELLRYGHRHLVLGGEMEEQSAVQSMLMVARSFTHGVNLLTRSDIADGLGVPGRALAPVLAQLESRGLLVVTDKDHVLPGRALHAISVFDVLEAIRDQPDAVPLTCRSAGQDGDDVVGDLLNEVSSARANSTQHVDFQTLVARANG